jgi:hypothetical protein
MQLPRDSVQSFIGKLLCRGAGAPPEEFHQFPMQLSVLPRRLVLIIMEPLQEPVKLFLRQGVCWVCRWSRVRHFAGVVV